MMERININGRDKISGLTRVVHCFNRGLLNIDIDYKYLCAIKEVIIIP